MTSTTLAVIADLVVAVALIAAATVLLALGKTDGTTAMAIYTAAIALIGGGSKAALALKVPTTSQSQSTGSQV